MKKIHYDVEILLEILETLKSNGVKNITPELIEAEYMRRNKHYNQYIEKESEVSQKIEMLLHLKPWFGIYKSEISQFQKSFLQITEDTRITISEKIMRLNNLEKTINNFQTSLNLLIEQSSQIQKRLDSLSKMQTNFRSMKVNVAPYRDRYEQIINSPRISMKDKILKLSDLMFDIEEYAEKMERINSLAVSIKRIIIEVKGLTDEYSVRNNPMFKSQQITDLLNQFNAIIENNNTHTMEKELTQFYKQISQVHQNLKTINNLQKYRDKRRRRNEKDDIITYDIGGVIITIDKQNKKYQIDFNLSMMQLLKQCKANKIKPLLVEKIKTQNIDELIKPIYVNEKNLLQFLQKGEIEISSELKTDIKAIINLFSIDDSDSKDETLTGNKEELDDIITLITMLEDEGYEGTQFKTANETIKYITEKYKDISIGSLDGIYELIFKLLLQYHPNGNYVYSTLQNAYNCIDRETLKKAFDDLENYDTLGITANIQKVIDFLKKYSRNKDKKEYTDDEIINFLRQKHEIMKTKYAPEVESEHELEENIDINQILFKLTNKRR